MEHNKTVLITGVTGQDGSYLAEMLLSMGHTVYGLKRRTSTETTERVDHLLDHAKFELIEGDIVDATGIFRIIKEVQPQQIYHLAAQSHVGSSFDDPISTFSTNALGTLNLLEAIRQQSIHTRFYNAATSELFGDTTVSPQNEETRFNPISPYAVSKLAAFHLTKLYREAYGIFACNGILFNHESPRRGENFVTMKICKYFARLKFLIELQKPSTATLPLQLGNIQSRRDWMHAEDAVRGMHCIINHESPGDFVLSSGVTRTIEDLLDVASKYAGVDWKTFVVINPKFYRPADVTLLCGDAKKAQSVFGWSPRISFKEMIEGMIDSEVEKIRTYE